MSDLIEREDVINALEKLSACEEYGVEVGTDEETYIGKYEAITAISDLPSADRPSDPHDITYINALKNRIKELEADRPQGKWILSDLQSQADNDNGNYSYVCTNCNHTDIHAKTQKVPYCWWCGARMKGADGEEN